MGLNATKVFGKRLREVRVKMNLTQAEFADVLGISRATVGFYENSERFPDIIVLDQIVKKTKVSVKFFLGYSDVMDESLEDLSFVSGLDDRAIGALVSLDSYAMSTLLKHKSFRDLTEYLALFTSPVLRPEVASEDRDLARAHAHVCLGKILDDAINKKMERDVTAEDYSVHLDFGTGTRLLAMLAINKNELDRVFSLSSEARKYLEYVRRDLSQYTEFNVQQKQLMLGSLRENLDEDAKRIGQLLERQQVYMAAIEQLSNDPALREEGVLQN